MYAERYSRWLPDVYTRTKKNMNESEIYQISTFFDKSIKIYIDRNVCKTTMSHQHSQMLRSVNNVSFPISLGIDPSNSLRSAAKDNIQMKKLDHTRL